MIGFEFINKHPIEPQIFNCRIINTYSTYEHDVNEFLGKTWAAIYEYNTISF